MKIQKMLTMEGSPKRGCIGNDTCDPRLLLTRYVLFDLLLPWLDLDDVWWLYCTCQTLHIMLSTMLDVQVYRSARADYDGDLHVVVQKRFRRGLKVPTRCIIKCISNLNDNQAHRTFVRVAAKASLDFVRMLSKHLPSHGGPWKEGCLLVMLQGAMAKKDPLHFGAVRGVIGDEVLRNMGEYDVHSLRDSALCYGHPEYALQVDASVGLEHWVAYAMCGKSTACLDYALKHWPDTPQVVYAYITSDYPISQPLGLRWAISTLKTRGYVINYEQLYDLLWHACADNSDPSLHWLAPRASAHFDARWRANPNAVPWHSGHPFVPGKVKYGHWLFTHPWNKTKKKNV